MIWYDEPSSFIRFLMKQLAPTWLQCCCMSVPCCFSWWIQGAIRGGLLFTSLFTTFVVLRDGMASVQLWLGKATAVSWQLVIQHDPALAIKSSKMVTSPPGSAIFIFQTVTGRKIVCSYANQLEPFQTLLAWWGPIPHLASGGGLWETSQHLTTLLRDVLSKWLAISHNDFWSTYPFTVIHPEILLSPCQAAHPPHQLPLGYLSVVCMVVMNKN